MYRCEKCDKPNVEYSIGIKMDSKPKRMLSSDAKLKLDVKLICAPFHHKIKYCRIYVEVRGSDGSIESVQSPLCKSFTKISILIFSRPSYKPIKKKKDRN